MLTSRLRFKVLSAAFSVVLITCVSGWIGLSYTNTVATSVTATTEINLPLLTNAINASNAMHNLSTMGRRLLEACEAADGSHRQLFGDTMTRDFAVIENLATFLNKVELRGYEVKVRSAKDELLHALKNLSTICDTRTTLQEQLDKQIKQTAATTTALNGILDSLSASFEKRLSRNSNEPRQKESVRSAGAPATSGESDYDVWFVLQALTRMKTRLDHLENDLSQSQSGSFVTSERRRIQLHETLINTLVSEYQKIAPILRKTGYTRASNDASSQIKLLSKAITGPVGIHDIWRRVSLFQSGTAIPRMALTRADIALASALRGIEMQARMLYQRATKDTHSAVAEARWVVASVTGLVALMLLVSGILLSARLTTPIERLKDYVIRLRRSNKLSQNMPEELMGRTDEIGALARSFDDLIADLSEARQRLVDESQAKIRTQFERLSAAIESIPQGLCLVDAEERLLMTNSRFLALYDLAPTQAREGMPIREVLAACGVNGAKLINRRYESDKPGRSFGLTLQQQILNFRNERTIVVKTAKTPEGGLVSVHEDITERRRQEEQITHLAHHDTLTGLANRKLFRDKFLRVLTNLEESQCVALLYMDLDHFKLVNDTLGHPVGDQLLIAVADRLRSCLREVDKAARLGGDEFAILLTDSPRMEDASRISNRIIRTVGLPYDIDGQNIVVGISVGVAMAPEDGTDPDRLMKCADMALYRAKREGRNTYRFFEPEMDEQIQAKRALELDLRDAEAGKDLELYYQPQIGIPQNNVDTFEALLRWKHKERGFVSPVDFIPIAEETGLIGPIGRWVLMQACQDAMAWPESIAVAVNISPVQFRTDTLLPDVEAALSASGLPPHRLELEITESSLMQDTRATIEVLETLREMGVHIAMDDFGTGYSSLSYIRKFYFDRIKIDRSFVHDLTFSKDSRAVVHAVCGLCSALGIDSVAEGVETAQQYQILKTQGCSKVQGYYFAAPMPASETLLKLKSELNIRQA